MSELRQAGALVREAIAAARSQPVPSLLTVVMVAGMCAAVLLTTGRTVAAEQAALAQIDAAGTRSVVVRADPAAGLTVTLLDRLRTVDAIEAVAGFGPIVDARNAEVPGALKVATRRAYGSIGDQTLVALPAVGGNDVQDRALASSSALTALGLHEGTGHLMADDGRDLVVVGELAIPAHLAFLEPVVVVPSSTVESAAGASPDDPLVVLVVLADSPQQVAVVEQTVRGLLAPTDPTKVSVETSAELAAIRAAVRGELGSYGRGLVLAILGGAAVLVAVNNLALVTLRRKDFGRRRALGATRALIVALLLSQVALLALLGVALGVVAGLVGLVTAGHPVPDISFTAAVAVAAVLTATLAAYLPAVIASRRDPLHELRVP